MTSVRLLLGLICAAAICLPAAAQTGAKDSTKPLTVNGKPIPKTRIDFVVKQQAARGTADSDQLRQAVTQEMINREVVVQEADRRGLLKNPDAQVQLDLARQEVALQAYFQDYFKSHPINEDTARAEYERIKAQRGDKEYKARHVLVEKDTEAKAIIEQLKKGAKFEDLAKQSKDAGSKDHGGELGWSVPGTYVKPFADALMTLEKGKYTETPVQSQFGWHVIRLDDVRPMQFPPFNDVKQQVVNALQQQEIQKLVGELRAKAKIE